MEDVRTLDFRIYYNSKGVISFEILSEPESGIKVSVSGINAQVDSEEDSVKRVPITGIREPIKCEREAITGMREPITGIRKSITGIRKAVTGSGDINSKNSVSINFSAKKYEGLSDSEKQRILNAAKFGRDQVERVLKQIRKNQKSILTEDEEICMYGFCEYYNAHVSNKMKLLDFDILGGQGKNSRYWSLMWKSYRMCKDNGWNCKIFLDAQFECYVLWDIKVDYPLPKHLVTERASRAYQNYVDSFANQEGYVTVKLKPVNPCFYDEWLEREVRRVIENNIKDAQRHISEAKWQIHCPLSAIYINPDRKDFEQIAFYHSCYDDFCDNIPVEMWFLFPGVDELFDDLTERYKTIEMSNPYTKKYERYKEIRNNKEIKDIVKNTMKDMKFSMPVPMYSKKQLAEIMEKEYEERAEYRSIHKHDPSISPARAAQLKSKKFMMEEYRKRKEERLNEQAHLRGESDWRDYREPSDEERLQEAIRRRDLRQAEQAEAEEKRREEWIAKAIHEYPSKLLRDGENDQMDLVFRLLSGDEDARPTFEEAVEAIGPMPELEPDTSIDHDGFLIPQGREPRMGDFETMTEFVLRTTQGIKRRDVKDWIIDTRRDLIKYGIC